MVAGPAVLLTQEIRNPRAGKYVSPLHACGGGRSAGFTATFLKHFTCRLVIFGYHDTAKDPLRPNVFASASFTPPFAERRKGATKSLSWRRRCAARTAAPIS